MGIIFKLAIRNMKRRKARYILTMCTLIIGVALFGGILIARDSFKVMFVNDIDKRMGTADILVRESETQDGWFKASKLKEIEKIDHVTDVSYRIAGFDVYSSIIPGGNQIDNSTKTAVYGIDINSKDEEELGSKPYIIDSDVGGDTLEELLDRGGNIVVITESLQIKLGKNFKAGDEMFVLPIDYQIPGKNAADIAANTDLWPKYRVVAIIRDLGEARDFDPETPSDYSSPSSGPCLFASIDVTHKLVDGLVDRRDQYNLVAIGVDDVNNVKNVVKEIEKELDKEQWVVADLKTNMITDINDSVDLMMTILMMFAVIALILSIILILNIFNIIKEEQEYETGMLQAVGASKSETFKMFLIQGAVMGIIGAVIGTICSYFMSYLIFYITVESLKSMPGEFGQMFAQTEFEIMLYPQTLLITLAVGMFSCIFAAIYPSWKASRKPLIECLNPLGKKSEREKKHHKRKLLYIALSSLLIAYGVWLLYGFGAFSGPRGRGNHSGGMAETTVSIMAPTFILLGLIGLTAIFVAPISGTFIKAFGPYLKQTKLLTKKNILRHRKRTILTYSMISLTVSYLVGISVIMGSFREGIHTTVTDVMGCDIRVFAANTPRSFGDELEGVDGVKDVMGVSHGNVRIWDQTQDKWVGHGLLEKEYDESVAVHIMETDKVAEHMITTEILEPTDMTLEEMMDDLSKENKMIITESEANDFNLDVGDETFVMFSLGYTYPNLDALFKDDKDNAQEDVVIASMEVVAIVKKFQGFATGEIIGQQEGVYNIFISWETYEKVAKNNLPGGNTDIIFRQETIPGYDIGMPNWFNFSDVLPILNTINEIDYYTTRMEYISPTYDLKAHNPFLINLTTSVVGIRTNYSDNFKSDSKFGSHTLLEKSSEYNGTTMEELLSNKSANVCVVDQTYVNNMRVIDPTFGINSNITIFRQNFTLSSLPLIDLKVKAVNGTLNPPSLGELYLTSSDNNYLKVISNKTSLESIITVNWTLFMIQNVINPYNITFESFVNSTIDRLNLEVYNYLTRKYEKLGSINSTSETNHTFTFNQNMPPFSYVNQTTGLMKLKVIGYNSSYNNDYNISIDCLSFKFYKSEDTFLTPNKWTPYKVVGIIEDPKLYRTERYSWLSSLPYVDVAKTENAVYINYEKARTQVYVHNRGLKANGSEDKITHVFIHCKTIDDIATTINSLRTKLPSNYTTIDLKLKTLEYRTYAFDWYIWIEEGADDEEVLTELTEFIEDKGYIVLFAFTNSYITQIFESMIDLITLIMNGILVFAIMIAMIGLALHALLSTMARRREIGMLRSIGLSKKGVIRTISGETIVISFLGTIIGILAGLLTGVLMVTSIPDTGFLTVTLTIPWLTIGILILVTLATAILSSRYPSRWAANINIIDAVRTR